MKLTCIRHTSLAVRKDVCYGQTDVPLAKSYPFEKEAVRERLGDANFQKVYASPLTRCKQLAVDLFQENQIVYDDRLKELNFGNWEMKSWDEIYEAENGKFWMDNYLEVSCDGGESYREFRDRVASFLEELKSTSVSDVALVTHGGVILIMKSILENTSIDEVFSTSKTEFGGIYEFELPNQLQET
ncbi:alpha-ribazole phosphatase family protein [Sunxiuqinia sp. A32]|uniref:alpha-ribazole phosphatase family protein n=1 Tax=Sunxiuqinia sp. A32 TaxID=3461496 RepID=UPI0040462BF9